MVFGKWYFGGTIQNPNRLNRFVGILVAVALASLLLIKIAVASDLDAAPYFLTNSEVDAFLQVPPSNEHQPLSMSFNGFEITATSARYSALQIEVNASPKLNLWRGRPNDLASAHGGSVTLIIDRVTTANSDNMIDRLQEKPWDKNITFDLNESSLKGERRVYLKADIALTDIANITGKLQITLPVSWAKYQFAMDAEQTPDVQSTLIDRIEINEYGIRIMHPRELPDFHAVVLGFTDDAALMLVTSHGVAGKQADNHWYYFQHASRLNHIEVFVPHETTTREVPVVLSQQ